MFKQILEYILIGISVLVVMGALASMWIQRYYIIFWVAIIVIIIGIIYCLLPNVTKTDISPFTNPPTTMDNVTIGNHYSIYIEGLKGLSESERQEIFNNYINEHGSGSFTFRW